MVDRFATGWVLLAPPNPGNVSRERGTHHPWGASPDPHGVGHLSARARQLTSQASKGKTSGFTGPSPASS